MEKSELTPTEKKVLNAMLGCKDPLTPYTELSKMCNLSSASFSTIKKNLETRGVLSKIRYPNFNKIRETQVTLFVWVNVLLPSAEIEKYVNDIFNESKNKFMILSSPQFHFGTFYFKDFSSAKTFEMDVTRRLLAKNPANGLKVNCKIYPTYAVKEMGLLEYVAIEQGGGQEALNLKKGECTKGDDSKKAEGKFPANSAWTEEEPASAAIIELKKLPARTRDVFVALLKNQQLRDGTLTKRLNMEASNFSRIRNYLTGELAIIIDKTVVPIDAFKTKNEVATILIANFKSSNEKRLIEAILKNSASEMIFSYLTGDLLATCWLDSFRRSEERRLRILEQVISNGLNVDFICKTMDAKNVTLRLFPEVGINMMDYCNRQGGDDGEWELIAGGARPPEGRNRYIKNGPTMMKQKKGEKIWQKLPRQTTR